MAYLSDLIAVAPRFARSANLERDTGQLDPLDGYIVTAQALDVVDRIATTATLGQAGGAWSLTGPYGSGKSSLALLLDAALGAPSELRTRAWEAVNAASSEVHDKLVDAHTHHSTLETGFNRGLVTARREPLTHTVLRALEASARGRWGKMPTVNQFTAARALRSALADAEGTDPRRTGPSPSTLVEIACGLAQDRPLLLVIDEFGKNLENIREDASAQTDPYLLQQLAEAGQGSGLPIFVVTLQHLSFEDYLVGADQSLRQEWTKVQGRFDDVSFTESAGQSRSLIGTVFDVHDDKLRKRIGDWANEHAESMASLGIQELADNKIIESCYPLHPLTTLVLPELCSRIGQNERTLFTFLAGPDERSASSFLARTELPSSGPLPSLGLHDAFEFFVAKGIPSSMPPGSASRLVEITTRLRDVTGLTEEQDQLALSIGLLNIVSTSGAVRASRPVLRLVAPDADKAINELEEMGVITYREFADEYRVWQGSDTDLDGYLRRAKQRIKPQALADILRSINEPSPVVAARHSAEVAVLRVFSRSYVDGIETLEPVSALSVFDGHVALVVGAQHQLPVVDPYGPNTKPILAALPADLTVLDAAAREYAAVTAVLEEPQVEHDWVVRRELSERLAQVTTAFEDALLSTFSAGNCRWVSLDGASGIELSPGRGTAPLSEASNRAYSDTPYVPNEMLNRAELTSQGAKSRRILLEAMIEQGHKPELGFEGFGPEVAMYKAVLGSTGLHGHDPKNDSMIFRPPKQEAMKGSWGALDKEFKRARSRRVNLIDIYSTLMSPPFGMKAGVVPVIVTAGLLAKQDEVAIYEHGTFLPVLTPEVSELMVRNPSHFEVKHFANTTGSRFEVVTALAQRFGIEPRFGKHRVANVLAVVGHLVSKLRRVENYTLKTNDLTPSARKVRDILLEAVEPDELLFDALPAALDLPRVPPDTKTYSRCVELVDRTVEALDELAGCYRELLQQLLRQLLEECVEAKRASVVGQAAMLEDEVLDHEIRAFVLTLGNQSADSDEDWIQAVATVLSKKASAEWTDDDRARFSHVLSVQVAAFHRLVALHADRRAHGGGQFDAVRVVITPLDGNEYTRLVEMQQGDDVDERLQRLLTILTDELGSKAQAEQALLAALSKRLVSTTGESVGHLPVLHSEEGAQSV